jgi:hypothetical protein
MRIFISEKEIVFNQLYGGWEEETLDKINTIFLNNHVAKET